MIMKRVVLAVLLSAFCISLSAVNKSVTLRSPDQKNVVEIQYAGNAFRYSLFREGTLIFTTEQISLKVGDKLWTGLDQTPKIVRKSVSSTVVPSVNRKMREIKEEYNQIVFSYSRYDLEFRSYNDGIAYRFVGKKDSVEEIGSEKSGFRFKEDCLSYTLLTKNLQNWFEENYTLRKLSDLPKDSLSIVPVMVEASNCNVLLAEANVRDYACSYLRPNGEGFDYVSADYPKEESFFDGTNKIYATSRYDYVVKSTSKRSFPWRVAGVFDKGKDAEMLHSELIYLLSDRTTVDYSWIKPGKVLWDWWNHNNIYNVSFKAGINTQTYLYMVDYAAEHGFEYVLIDEGWSAKDDLLTLNSATDIPKICQYAENKGVGICLWAKWINVDKQLEEAFDMMSSWGVKGVKIDFMDRNDAKMLSFYERVAKKATEKKLLVDLHGSYPSDGLSAMYPNLMTREGVLGLEYDKWSNRATPSHQLIIPFLRQWVEAMDFTPGAMLNVQPEQFRINAEEPMSQGTRCHQMAMYVVYESPLQMISDSPSKYDENSPWLPFLRKVPTTWDETIPLFGEVGKNLAVARRKDGDFYVGVMSAESARDTVIDFSFLPEGCYSMKCYFDGVNADSNARDYSVQTVAVNNSTRFPFHLARNGGFVGVITKDTTVPVVLISDLYFPGQDIGDNFDLLTPYALSNIDLKAVVFDVSQHFREINSDNSILRDPGFVPVSQLNYLFDKNVPCGCSPFTPLDSLTDGKLTASEFEQSGINLFLDVLRGSDVPIEVVSTGSCRPLAIAFNREPELMKNKVARIHLCAGSSSNSFLEWNIALDTLAATRVLQSGLPLALYPCATAKGPFDKGVNNTFWSLRDLNWIMGMDDCLKNYLVFNMTAVSDRPDYLNYLTSPLPPSDSLGLLSRSADEWYGSGGKHYVWETAVWQQVAGLKLVRRQNGDCRLVDKNEVKSSDTVFSEGLRHVKGPSNVQIYYRDSPEVNEIMLNEALPALYTSFKSKIHIKY